MPNELDDTFKALKEKLIAMGYEGAAATLALAIGASQLPEVQACTKAMADDAVKDMNPADQDKFRYFAQSIATQNLCTLLALGR